MYSFIVPIISMGGIGAVLAALLVIADSRLKTAEDPRIAEIHDVLPGANCGACGLPGCHQFAEQVIAGTQAPTGCSAGGPEGAKLIADILGVDIEVGLPVKARVMCLGGTAECAPRADYQGIKDCRAAALVAAGAKGCVYGCLGFGTCVAACPFGAMEMDPNGLPRISDHCCTGCGLCVAACPRDLITMVPEQDKVFVGCSSPEKGKSVKEICARGCIGCSLCVKVCPLEAIVMDGNLPVVDQAKCDACGICIERCPTDSLIEPQVKASIIKATKKEAV